MGMCYVPCDPALCCPYTTVGYGGFGYGYTPFLGAPVIGAPVIGAPLIGAPVIAGPMIGYGGGFGVTEVIDGGVVAGDVGYVGGGGEVYSTGYV